jgi:hypothetical protein
MFRTASKAGFTQQFSFKGRRMVHHGLREERIPESRVSILRFECGPIRKNFETTRSSAGQGVLSASARIYLISRKFEETPVFKINGTLLKKIQSRNLYKTKYVITFVT